MTRRDFVSFAVASTALRAESSQERGRKIVGDMVQALGGDAFRNLLTRTEQGRAYSFYREQLTGLSMAWIYTKYVPGHESGTVGMKQRQAFGKKQEDVVILTDKEAWETTYRGAYPLGEQRVKQFHESTLHDIFYILRMRLAEPGMGFEAKGHDVVENQPVEALEIYDSENRAVTVWVHSSTMLPVKQLFKRWDQTINDRRDEVSRYTKYRDIGNRVMWPFNIQRERDTEKVYEIYAEKVTAGDDLADSLFQLPPGITIINNRK